MPSKRRRAINAILLIAFVGLCGLALTWTTPSINNELTLEEGISFGDTIYMIVIRGNETTDSDGLVQSPNMVPRIPIQDTPC